jgi:hypothetical protein
MFMVWVALGAAGAGLVFAVYPWPAPGMRMKNAAWFLAAAAAGLIVWLFEVDKAWSFPVAWYAAFMLLQFSQLFRLESAKH